MVRCCYNFFSFFQYFLVSVCSLMLIATSSIAQEPDTNTRRYNREVAEQKMLQWKKIRLLDALNLSEDKADKFLLLFNAESKKLQEEREKLRAGVERLQQAVEQKGNIKAKMDEFMVLHNDYHQAIRKYLMAFEGILSQEEYAKFVVFEQTFFDDMMRSLDRKSRRYKSGSSSEN